MSAYDEFIHLAQSRYSCRDYDRTNIRRDLIEKVIEVARLAPSAVNRQPWKFIVADTPEMLAGIRSCYPREWLATAPAIIVAVGFHDRAWHRTSDGKDHTDIDLAIAVEHLCLAAASLGLGTCWICNFDNVRCARLLNLPANTEAIALIPIGYAAAGTHAPEKKRKPIDEILQWEPF